jgi:type II secretory pathway component PulC
MRIRTGQACGAASSNWLIQFGEGRAMNRHDLRSVSYVQLRAFIAALSLVSAAMPTAVATAQVQSQPAATPSNPMAAQSLEQLSTIVDRPLFSPSRHPPAPPPAPAPIVQAAEPPAPPPSPPNLVLFGVVMDGESARAVVRSGDRKTIRAQIGDEIDGWKVSQIEGRKVVLSQDGRFATFTLFSDDRGKSESVGRPAPVGEPNDAQRQMQAQQSSQQVAAAQSIQPKRRRRSRD